MPVHTTRPQPPRQRLLSFLPYVLALGLAGLTQPADAAAATITATPATLKAALAQVKPGDTLKLTGTFEETLIRDRDFGGVLIDAKGASFAGGLVLRNVHNVIFHGGTYGSTATNLRNNQTVDVFDSSNVSFRSVLVVGNSDGFGTGMMFRRSSQVTVRDSRFSGHRAALALSSSSDSLLMRNDFTGMSSDAINISDSHRIVASFNQCSGFAPSPGAHADCIQMWSLEGQPRQSDVALLNNMSVGKMQGFTSFNASAGGAERVLMAGNVVMGSMPQGIACYSCLNSQFVDNLLVTLPDARWRTALNLVGGSANVAANNSFIDYRTLAPTMARGMAAAVGDPTSLLASVQQMGITLEQVRTTAMPGFAVGGSRWDNRAFQLAAVPEPQLWAELMLGLGLVGTLHRRRSRTPQRAC